MWDAIWFLVTILVWVRLFAMSGTIRQLRRRIDTLERDRAATDALAPAAIELDPTPAPAAVPAIAPVAEIAEPAPPRIAEAPPLTPEFASAPMGGTPPAPRPARNFELQFGGLWLQNIGAVLLLLGVFFMIVWGYTTGRLGPEVIVAAGIGVGLVLAWRGDRTARRLPALGHTLIGVGLGVVYLSLYLGHFTLRVLPSWLAFGSLTLVSMASIATGIRYRTQAVAVLGVVGAFVPPLAAAWIPLHGFPMTPVGLIAYLAGVNVVVLGLAVQPGWSGLNLAALTLSAITWTITFTQPTWSWGIEISLAGLFAFLGLAPVPRLSRVEGPVRPMDLAIIAVAPLCLIASSWPMLAHSDRSIVAMLLFALAGLYLVSALWVDTRRTPRDLWRPLTAASTLFLTAALQRWVGTENTPMAWCIEGALLVGLGLGARGEWLRLCGYVVAAIGALWTLGAMLLATWEHNALPVLYPAGIRDLVCVAAVLAFTWAIDRRRAELAAPERFLSSLWTGLGQLMLMVWTGREAYHLAYALEGSGGRWQRMPALTAPGGVIRRDALAIAVMSAAWLAQGSALLLSTRRMGLGFVRVCGYAITGIASLAVLAELTSSDGWSNDQYPVFYAAALIPLACITGLGILAVRLTRRRESLSAEERRMPEFWTSVAGVLMLAWSAREATHVARSLEGLPGVLGRFLSVPNPEALARSVVIAAAITSGAWLVQAVVVLALGWARNSRFLRWSGLVLFGLTVIKFLLVDLQTVDVFWRFLTAIVVGITLLGVSYAYQRKTRMAAEEGLAKPPD